MPKPRLRTLSAPFFEDPAIDRLIEIILGLSANLASLESAFIVLSAHLEATGGAPPSDLAKLRDDPAIAARLERRQRESISVIVDALS